MAKLLTVLVVEGVAPKASGGKLNDRGERSRVVHRINCYIDTGAPFPTEMQIVVDPNNLPMPGRYLLPAGALQRRIKTSKTSDYANEMWTLDGFDPLPLVSLKEAADEIQGMLRADAGVRPAPVRAAG